MRQVLTLELVGLKKLDCDLYDEKGDLVYKKETEFTPELLMMLNHTKVFKRDEEPLTGKKSKKRLPCDKDKTQKNLNRSNLKTDVSVELTQKTGKPDGRNTINQLKNTSLPDIASIPESLRPNEKTGYKTRQQKKERLDAEKEAIAKAVFFIKQLEPKNEEIEFKSVIDEDRKRSLLYEIQSILYNAANSFPVNLEKCVNTTESILSEVYTKLQNVNNFNELRINNHYTFTHSLNVAMLSAVLGREIGFNENKVKDLVFSAFLHDVGKTQIPRRILYKQGSLTGEEMMVMQKHAELGYSYLVEKLKLPPEIARPALEHHERWEGQGYPQGLRQNEISEFSQIIAIVDVYDALVSDKIYKNSVKSIEAMKILLNEELKSFNPLFLNKFIYLGVVNKSLPL